jgi:MerR family transcriptional regulator, copper efflux regulator
MPPLRIGKLARLANVNVQTVRFYERKGLLPKPLRRPSGYREFPHETIGLVRLIKHIQGLGFSLKEIKGLIALRMSPSATLESACGGLERKLEEIDAKIRTLEAIRSTLAQMIENHRRGGNKPLAQAINRHVDKLANEAITGHSQKLGQRNLARPAPRNRLPESRNAS